MIFQNDNSKESLDGNKEKGRRPRSVIVMEINRKSICGIDVTKRESLASGPDKMEGT